MKFYNYNLTHTDMCGNPFWRQAETKKLCECYTFRVNKCVCVCTIDGGMRLVSRHNAQCLRTYNTHTAYQYHSCTNGWNFKFSSVIIVKFSQRNSIAIVRFFSQLKPMNSAAGIYCCCSATIFHMNKLSMGV